MSPSSAERSSSGLARVAVVGASTECGVLVREALERRGVSGRRVDLYGTSTGEALLSEYAGEARLVQEPDVEEVHEHDVVFLCENGAVAQRLASRSGLTVIDLVGAPVEREGWLAVAHPIALLLAELLGPLERRFGVAEALAVVLRPAADFGPDGPEELREQTVGLLGFSDVPKRVFGQQLAFNLLPEGPSAARRPRLEARLTRDVARLFGWDTPRLALRLVTVPLFYGHAVQCRVRFCGPASLDDLRAVLVDEGWLEPHAEATPIEVNGQVCVRVGEPGDDGLGGFWIWAVAGETAQRAAEQAVRVAAGLVDL